jgi:hypothetical protein
MLGAHGDQHQAIAAALERADVAYDRVFVWPFGTPQLRQLVERLTGEQDDDLVRTVSALIRSHGLPRTRFMMAALVAVVRAEGEAASRNESSLLTAYVHLLLGAGDVGDPEGLGQDFRRREYLLGCFAAELLTQGRERMTRYEAERLVTDYFGERSYASSPTAVLQSFIDRRVLVQDGDYVGFRHRALLHLFGGSHMNEVNHGDFREAVLEDPITFAPVITHAAGLGRNDETLLDRIGARVREALVGLREALAKEPFDELLASDEHQEANLDVLREQLRVVAPRVPDEQFDTRVPLGEDDEAPDSRQSDPFSDLVDLSALLSAVLQRSELVNDGDLKTGLLRLGIEAECAVGASVVVMEAEDGLIRDILSNAQNTPGGELQVLPKDLDVDYVVRLLITLVVLMRSLGQLSAEHLGAAVERLMAETEFTESAGHLLVLTLLAATIGHRGWPDRLAELYAKFPDHPFLRELVRNVATSLYRNTPEQISADKLEVFLADIYLPGVDRRGPALSQLRNQLRLSRRKHRSLLARGGSLGADQLDVSPLDGAVPDGSD